MNYEHHEQQRQVQTADLLSNIAGSMGLFLGMSTVTLLEIFIFLFKSIWGTINTERQKQFVKSVIQEDEEKNNNVIVVENSNADDKDSLAHSDTEDTFKDQEAPEVKEIPIIRKPSLRRTFPRKSLSIVINGEKRPSILSIRRSSESLAKRDSLAVRDFKDWSKLRKASQQHHGLTIDVPGPSRRSFHRLSVALPGEAERRPSTTDLFRAARRPSMNPIIPAAHRRSSINPLTSTMHRRPSAVVLPPTVSKGSSMYSQPKEIHVQIIRRPSAAAVTGMKPPHNLNIRRKSTYNNSLV